MPRSRSGRQAASRVHHGVLPAERGAEHGRRGDRPLGHLVGASGAPDEEGHRIGDAGRVEVDQQVALGDDLAREDVGDPLGVGALGGAGKAAGEVGSIGRHRARPRGEGQRVGDRDEQHSSGDEVRWRRFPSERQGQRGDAFEARRRARRRTRQRSDRRRRRRPRRLEGQPLASVEHRPGDHAVRRSRPTRRLGEHGGHVGATRCRVVRTPGTSSHGR